MGCRLAAELGVDCCAGPASLRTSLIGVRRFDVLKISTLQGPVQLLHANMLLARHCAAIWKHVCCIASAVPVHVVEDTALPGVAWFPVQPLLRGNAVCSSGKPKLVLS